MKKMLAIILCCTLLAGCGNGNVFSWAHNPGSGDFASLKSDGDAAMKNNDFSKAAEYYKAALGKNPNDAETALAYATARLFEVINSQYGDIVNTFLSGGGTSSDELLGFLTGDTIQKLADALYDSMGTAGSEDGYLANAANQPGASTDILINAAVTNILLGVAEFLTSVAPYQEYITLNSDFTVSFPLGVPTDPDIIAALIAAIEKLIARIETALRWLQNAPIADLPPGVDQSQILETINNYLALLKAELEAAKSQL